MGKKHLFFKGLALTSDDVEEISKIKPNQIIACLI